MERKEKCVLEADTDVSSGEQVNYQGQMVNLDPGWNPGAQVEWTGAWEDGEGPWTLAGRPGKTVQCHWHFCWGLCQPTVDSGLNRGPICV